MNAIWFLSKERNMMIIGFNKVVKDGVLELWVTDPTGGSRKIAEGSKADKLENALVSIAWTSSPCIICDGENFATNVDTNEGEEA